VIDKCWIQAGAHWLTLFDAYGASGIALLFVVFFEVVGLAYGFGAERIRNALREMLGWAPPRFILIFWKYTAPIISAMLFISLLLYYQPQRYPDGRDYPLWASLFGLTLSSCSMVVIPGFAFYYLFLAKGHGDVSLKQRLLNGIHPPRQLDIYRPGSTATEARGEEEMQIIDHGQMGGGGAAAEQQRIQQGVKPKK